MTPMPPACAMALASRASVTVSMAEDRMGILTEIDRVTREATSTSFGSTSDGPGRISTSSKVSAKALSGNRVLSLEERPSGIGQPLWRGRSRSCAVQHWGSRLAASFSSLYRAWKAARAVYPSLCTGRARLGPRLVGSERLVGPAIEGRCRHLFATLGGGLGLIPGELMELLGTDRTVGVALPGRIGDPAQTGHQRLGETAARPVLVVRHHGVVAGRRQRDPVARREQTEDTDPRRRLDRDRAVTLDEGRIEIDTQARDAHRGESVVERGEPHARLGLGRVGVGRQQQHVLAACLL